MITFHITFLGGAPIGYELVGALSCVYEVGYDEVRKVFVPAAPH